jgi:hypothetical protein
VHTEFTCALAIRSTTRAITGTTYQAKPFTPNRPSGIGLDPALRNRRRRNGNTDQEYRRGQQALGQDGRPEILRRQPSQHGPDQQGNQHDVADPDGQYETPITEGVSRMQKDTCTKVV